jgi:hypothetical protein
MSIKQLDKPGNGRHIHWAKVVTKWFVLEFSCGREAANGRSMRFGYILGHKDMIEDSWYKNGPNSVRNSFRVGESAFAHLAMINLTGHEGVAKQESSGANIQI